MKSTVMFSTLAAATILVVSATSVQIAKQNKSLNVLRSEIEELKLSKEKAESKILELEKQLDETEKIKLSTEQELKKLKESQNKKNTSVNTENQSKKSVHFNPNNLLESSNLTNDSAYKMLSGSSLQPFSRYYVDAENKYGINAIFLMSLTSLESGYGKSNIAVNKNNIGGVISGNGNYMNFTNKGSCIEYIAKLLSEHYLKEGSEYFNGYSVWNVNKNYCEQNSWADDIVDIANTLISELHK